MSAETNVGRAQGTWLIKGARPLGGDPADIADPRRRDRQRR